MTNDSHFGESRAMRYLKFSRAPLATLIVRALFLACFVLLVD
jgi:hypothetical protein